MEIRRETRLIVRRGTDFLVGTILGGPDLKWSRSPWDAWSTRSREAAARVARKTGGEIWLFNPVAGQLREARIEVVV